MHLLLKDTICAPATPPGASGLAVIRVSGNDAFAVTDACFRGKYKIADAPSHTILYGKFYSGETLTDTVTASVFRAPHSYTGEHSVEIGCHGGAVVSDLIVQTLIAAGCRFAEPGEFTKRAFLNGKLDLTQAEAVADLIHASSQTGSQVSARQLEGGFTARMKQLRNDLLDICALLEVELDFAHEDIEFVDKSHLRGLIAQSRDYCASILELHHSSAVLRDGLYVGIVGYPNAGKSTLFNALVGRQRAIVSNIPGTTRDYIEETAHIGSIAIKYFDTAGIRDTKDVIEIEGIRLAESVMRQCNVLLVVNDAAFAADFSLPLFRRITAAFPDATALYVQNKIDALSDESDLLSGKNVVPAGQTLAVSARDGSGIPLLRDRISAIAARAAERFPDVLLNARHAAHLRDVIAQLGAALATAEDDMSNEFITIDVRAAIDSLGKITGQVWSEEVLNQIFSRFCIGK